MHTRHQKLVHSKDRLLARPILCDQLYTLYLRFRCGSIFELARRTLLNRPPRGTENSSACLGLATRLIWSLVLLSN